MIFRNTDTGMAVQNVGDNVVHMIPGENALVIVGDVRAELKNIGETGVVVHMFRKVQTGEGETETYELGVLHPGETRKY